MTYQGITIYHKRQAHKRTYSLHFNENSELILTTSMTFPDSKINDILKRHNRWINNNHARFLEKRAQEIVITGKSGDTIPLLGELFTIYYQESRYRKIKISIEGNILLIKRVKSANVSLLEARTALKSFISQMIKDYCISRSYFYCKKYTTEFNDVRIKEQKTKWGSCSSKKNLNYNFNLAFLSREVVEYIIIHEVCHLKELHHGPSFWKLVEQQCPNYKLIRKALKYAPRITFK